MKWIKTFMQDRKLKFWENYEILLSIRLLSIFASQRHSVGFPNITIAITDLPNSGIFWSHRFTRETIQMISEIEVPFSEIREGVDAVFEKFCWKCNCYIKTYSSRVLEPVFQNIYISSSFFLTTRGGWEE